MISVIQRKFDSIVVKVSMNVNQPPTHTIRVNRDVAHDKTFLHHITTNIQPKLVVKSSGLNWIMVSGHKSLTPFESSNRLPELGLAESHISENVNTIPIVNHFVVHVDHIVCHLDGIIPRTNLGMIDRKST